VGRRLQPEIKQRLLDACTDYALEHGLPDRLEPLAAAAGTSARMLIYHFGTRDALLRAVLGQARQRQLDTFGALLRARSDEPYLTTLASAWASMSGPDGQPFLRMFGQWRTGPVQPLWPELRRAATTDWLGPLADGLRSIGHPELATLVLAVIRGLLMDLDATGDTTRADRAFQQFLDTLGWKAETAPMTIVLRYLTTPEQPWRNGRGVTRELQAGDGWRLSVATVSAAGEFSSYPGLERTFIAARGRLEMTVDGTLHQVAPGMLLRFGGEAEVSAVPTDGEAIAVNVMTDRERCTATVQIERIDGPSPAATALVLLSGEALVEGYRLEPFDAVHPGAAGAADCRNALVAVIVVHHG
jgi:environmental stress-induced protein Ves